MDRVLVIGNGGAGKSSFAKRLGTILGIPVVNLDAFFWKPNWVPTPAGEWKEKVHHLVQQERWIMDGNYSGTYKERMDAADTIIYLDIPRMVCLFRVWKRWLSGRRIDMIPDCREKVDLEFMKWIWNYPKNNHQKNMTLLREYKRAKEVLVFRSRKEVHAFITATMTHNI